MRISDWSSDVCSSDLLVRKLGREFLVAASDIEWLQAAGNYVNLRVRGRDYPLRSTIAGIAAQLDPDRFVRIHRSYIVNLDTVASIEPLDSGDARVHLQDGTALPCSRRHRDRSDEHPSELQPLMRIPSADFRLKKK